MRHVERQMSETEVRLELILRYSLFIPFTIKIDRLVFAKCIIVQLIEE